MNFSFLNPVTMLERTGEALNGRALPGGEQHPYAQQVARNLGHAGFGDEIGNKVDRGLLGDVDTSLPGTPMAVPTMQSQQSIGELLAQLFQQGQK